MPTEEQIKTLTDDLDAWVKDRTAQDGERRAEARDRIIEAYRGSRSHLDLTSLNLTSLPESIGNLTALTSLSLYNNQLTSLPESIGNLAALTRLNLYNNQLASLPESIGNLAALTRLDLSHNQLASLPESVGNLASLKNLVLHDNQLTSLPESIGNLAALTFLNLYNNQLTSLPESIGNLTALTNLNLYNNQLTSLPESIGNLTALTNLNLYSNQLTSLPESIGNLTALTSLNLHSNQLTSLPTSLFSTARQSSLRIGLQGNRTTAENVKQLMYAARGRNISISTSIYEPLLPHPESNEGNASASLSIILNTILSHEDDPEKRKELETFVESTSSEFRNFISQCHRTKGWESHEGRAGMQKALLEIIHKMHGNKQIKERCELVTRGATETCGDRIAITFINLQIAANNSVKKLEEMTVEEIYADALPFAVHDFLTKQAREKVKTLSGFDEIETHLAYMQIAKDLGLNLEGTQMLYRGLSGVSDADLEAAKKLFLEKEKSLVAKFIYNNAVFTNAPFVEKIREEIAKEDEENEVEYSSLDVEIGADFKSRMDALKDSREAAIVSKIEQAFEEITKSAEIDGTRAAQAKANAAGTRTVPAQGALVEDNGEGVRAPIPAQSVILDADGRDMQEAILQSFADQPTSGGASGSSSDPSTSAERRGIFADRIEEVIASRREAVERSFATQPTSGGASVSSSDPSTSAERRVIFADRIEKVIASRLAAEKKGRG